tara:strand:- start:954 stop:1460 length:507 start_codon:yes stop_codon:yes gene_type:complete
MVIKDKIFKSKLKQISNFHFKDVYSYIYDYVRDEGWDLHESLYREKTIAENLREMTIEWKAKKKISDYFQYEINMRWIMLYIKDVKVMIDGQEKKLQNGTFEINFDAALVKDWQNKWDSGLMKSLREIYDEYIITDTIEDYEVHLNEKVNEMIAVIKSYMAIEAQHQY